MIVADNYNRSQPKRWRRPGFRAVMVMALAVALLPVRPGSAPAYDAEAYMRLHALRYARAIEQAFWTLDDWIRRTSTAAITPWGQDGVPPGESGWKTHWTATGIRAHYCDGTLLVYLHPEAVKGIGTHHITVMTAPTTIRHTTGIGRRNQGRPLMWLENDATRNNSSQRATGSQPAVGPVPTDGSQPASGPVPTDGLDPGGARVRGDERGVGTTITLPACMPSGLPSGRAAIAGKVTDPWTTTRERVQRERRTLSCGEGLRGTGILQERSATRDINGRGQDAGRTVTGEWDTLRTDCRPEREITRTFLTPCDNGETGKNVWRRRTRLTNDGERDIGTPVFVMSTCPDVQGGKPPAPLQPTITSRERTERRSSSCSTGYTGRKHIRRTTEVRTITYPWRPGETFTNEVVGPWNEYRNTCRRRRTYVRTGDQRYGGYGSGHPPGHPDAEKHNGWRDSSRDNARDGGGRGRGCFLADAPVNMADGTTKPIAHLCIGDLTAGGPVTGTYTFRAADQDWVRWRGITVSSRHIVLEGNHWIPAGDSLEAQPVKVTNTECHLVDVESHRLPIAGQIVQDYIAFCDTDEIIGQEHAFQLASYNHEERIRAHMGISSADLSGFMALI